MTFSELKQRDVVNISDGRRLGKPMDLMLTPNACVDALIVPASGGFLSLIRQDRDGCLIPWSCVVRIGDDVILVDIREELPNKT